MSPEQLEALRKSMAETWSPAVWIGREHVLELIDAAERESKMREALEFADARIGHFAGAPQDDPSHLVRVFGEIARKVKEALAEEP